VKPPLIATFLLAFASLTHADSARELIKGPTFEGVIFSPSMIANGTAMKGNPHWNVEGVDFKAHNVYWTPSPKLVRLAEASLARQYRDAQKRMPPGCPHARAWYSPKNFSPDRERKLPTDAYDNFFYDWEPSLLTPQMKRQYIGVTSNGRRYLVISLGYRYC
jgi:hypothetical protein